jgi:putative flippase GtrA
VHEPLPPAAPLDSRVHPQGSVATVWELLRFGLAGVVNAGMGYALYAGFIFMGAPMYLAQALGHVLGTCFNYYSHSRFVFQKRPGLGRYLLSSGFNYLAGLVFLALSAHWVASPYLAGLIGTALTAAFSYLSLKLYAFRHRPSQG